MTFMTLTKYLKYVRFTMSLLFTEYPRSISYLSSAPCLASIDVLLVVWWRYWRVDWGRRIKKTVESHLLL